MAFDGSGFRVQVQVLPQADIVEKFVEPTPRTTHLSVLRSVSIYPLDTGHLLLRR